MRPWSYPPPGCFTMGRSADEGVCDSIYDREPVTDEEPGCFHLLDLPGELRNMIYEEVLHNGYRAINRAIGSFVNNVMYLPGVPEDDLKPKGIQKSTPSLLLVCKQVYHEAHALLKRHPLRMTHGLFDFRLSDFISTPTLRNLTSIVLTQTGHNVLDGRLRHSFIGHQRLCFGLADALKDYGHSVQYLELHFDSPQLQWHIDNCWNTTEECDMRKWLTTNVERWIQVRGIRKVKIVGWLPEHLRRRMISFMQSDFSPLAKLPPNVIARIASYTANIDSISASINRLNNIASRPHQGTLSWCQDGALVSSEPRRVPTSVPGILLADRSTFNFFIQPFTASPLVLDLHGAYRQKMKINEFVGTDMLNRVQVVQIHIRHRSWLHFVENICVNMLKRKAPLELFQLTLDDDRRRPAPRRATGLQHIYPDSELCYMLEPLRCLRNVEKVVFGGDLASPADDYFLDYLKNTMMSGIKAREVHPPLLRPDRMKVIHRVR